MNDSNQGQTGRQTQRDLLESGERAMQQSITMPINQAVEMQRNVARLFLTGLEMQDRAQSQWIEMMKSTFDDYLNTMETTAEGVSQATRQGVQSAMEQGQAMATGESQARSSGLPQGTRQEPTMARSQRGGQEGLRYAHPPSDQTAQGPQYQATQGSEFQGTGQSEFQGTGGSTQGLQYQGTEQTAQGPQYQGGQELQYQGGQEPQYQGQVTGQPSPGTGASTYGQPPEQEYGQAPSYPGQGQGQEYGGAENLSYGQPAEQGQELGEPSGQGAGRTEGQRDRTQPPGT